MNSQHGITNRPRWVSILAVFGLAFVVTLIVAFIINKWLQAPLPGLLFFTTLVAGLLTSRVAWKIF